jgi:hypothetical protein
MILEDKHVFVEYSESEWEIGFIKMTYIPTDTVVSCRFDLRKESYRNAYRDLKKRLENKIQYKEDHFSTEILDEKTVKHTMVEASSGRSVEMVITKNDNINVKKALRTKMEKKI